MIATSGSGANVSVGDVVAVHEGNDKRASWKLAQPLLSSASFQSARISKHEREELSSSARPVAVDRRRCANLCMQYP